MPIFEFECQACGTPFEELVRNAAVVEVACPKCGSQKARKKMSTFASKVSGKSSFSLGASSSSNCSTGST